MSDLSISVGQPAAHANTVVAAVRHGAGKTKESSCTTSNPLPLSLPSVTQPNPSLGSSSHRDAVTPPLYCDIEAVVVKLLTYVAYLF